MRISAALFAGLLAAAAPARAGSLIALVQDSGGKPVEDAVVFIYDVPGEKFRAPAEPVNMDQVNKEFVPHVQAVLIGTKLRFPNKDQIHHHIYSFSAAKRFEIPLYKNKPQAPIRLDAAGVIKLGCNIHDWMRGYVLVLENPYFAKTGPDGRAELGGLPKGKFQVAVWSESLSQPIEETLQSVELGARPVSIQFSPKLKPLGKKKKPALSDY